jgi:hypothetical protein
LNEHVILFGDAHEPDRFNAPDESFAGGLQSLLELHSTTTP